MKTEQIELSNQECLNGFQALQSISSDDLEFGMTYTMSLNLKELRRASENYSEFREAIFKETCELDERGEPVVDKESRRYQFKNVEDEIAATSKITALNKTMVSLNLYVYPLSAFAKAKIAHTLLEHLTWMVREGDEPAPPKSRTKKST